MILKQSKTISRVTASTTTTIFLTLVSLFFASCSTPKYTAKNKSDLAKLCVYEFPYDPTPIRSDSTKINLNIIKHVRAEVDCDSLSGIQEVNIPVVIDTFYIERTNYLVDPVKQYYMQSLEIKVENLEKDVEDITHEARAWRRKYRIAGGTSLLFIVLGVLYIVKR